MADERHEWFLNQIFRHRAALYRYLRKFTSGAEDVEDLVQETYVRVYALVYQQRNYLGKCQYRHHGAIRPCDQRHRNIGQSHGRPWHGRTRQSELLRSLDGILDRAEADPVLHR